MGFGDFTRFGCMHPNRVKSPTELRSDDRVTSKRRQLKGSFWVSPRTTPETYGER